MEGKLQAAKQEAQDLLTKKEELHKRMAIQLAKTQSTKGTLLDEELGFLKEQESQLMEDLELAESSRIGVDQVLQILRVQLKNLTSWLYFPF